VQIEALEGKKAPEFVCVLFVGYTKAVNRTWRWRQTNIASFQIIY